MQNDRTLLQVKNLKKYFPIKKGVFRKVHGYVKAVDDVSFSIKKGETLSLVGESGCGKTTIGRLILRAIKATSGEIIFHLSDKEVKINKLHESELKDFRKYMQLIFQDPGHLFSLKTTQNSQSSLPPSIIPVSKLAEACQACYH